MLDLPLETEFWFCVSLCTLIAITAFVSSTRTGNCSFVDRVWSISPVCFAWILASRSFTSKTVLMALWATAWGSRLTFNFHRRGGYQPGTEDYRWNELRMIIPSKPLWIIFNLIFISSYQNVLLFLITIPIYVVTFDSNPYLTPMEVFYGVLLFTFLMGETIADHQQWMFQEKKYELIKIHKSIDKIKFPYRYGFCTTGIIYC
jgi:steroid 5-alpha reductase family enzyme